MRLVFRRQLSEDASYCTVSDPTHHVVPQRFSGSKYVCSNVQTTESAQIYVVDEGTSLSFFSGYSTVSIMCGTPERRELSNDGFAA